MFPRSFTTALQANGGRFTQIPSGQQEEVAVPNIANEQRVSPADLGFCREAKEMDGGLRFSLEDPGRRDVEYKIPTSYNLLHAAITMAKDELEYITVPYPLAMVVCDMVWRDPYSGKMTLLGTFSALGGSKFPLQHPVMCAYVSLTDGRGDIQLKLRLVDVDESRDPIFEIEEMLTFRDPRTIYETIFSATNIVIPEPGEYRLQLFAGDDFIIERRILAIQSRPNESSAS